MELHSGVTLGLKLEVRSDGWEQRFKAVQTTRDSESPQSHLATFFPDKPLDVFHIAISFQISLQSFVSTDGWKI